MSNTKDELWQKFHALGQAALTMSHYALAKAMPDTTLDEWRQFLQEADVEEFVKQEMRIIQDSIQKKMISDITDGSDKSVGRAQLITTLDKLNGNAAVKEGPVFIYTYVPLDKEQSQAENLIKLNRDPFKRRQNNNATTETIPD